MAGIGVAQASGGGLQMKEQPGGEVVAVMRQPVQARVDLLQEGRRPGKPRPGLVPQGPQLHGVERGGNPVAHHVRHHAGIAVPAVHRLQPVEVPADQFMRHVPDAELVAEIHGQFRGQGLLLDHLGAPQILLGRAQVAEHFNAPHHRAPRIMDRGDGHFHRHPVPGLRLRENQHRLDAGPARDDRAVQGAELLAAKLAAVLVHVDQDVVEAALAHHLGGCPAGDGLRRPVPEYDAAFQIGDVHAIRHGIQDVGRQEMGKQFRRNRRRPGFSAFQFHETALLGPASSGCIPAPADPLGKLICMKNARWVPLAAAPPSASRKPG